MLGILIEDRCIHTMAPEFQRLGRFENLWCQDERVTRDSLDRSLDCIEAHGLLMLWKISSYLVA